MASSITLKRVPPTEVKSLNLDPVDDITRGQAADIIGKVSPGAELESCGLRILSLRSLAGPRRRRGCFPRDRRQAGRYQGRRAFHPRPGATRGRLSRAARGAAGVASAHSGTHPCVRRGAARQHLRRFCPGPWRDCWPHRLCVLDGWMLRSRGAVPATVVRPDDCDHRARRGCRERVGRVAAPCADHDWRGLRRRRRRTCHRRWRAGHRGSRVRRRAHPPLRRHRRAGQPVGDCRQVHRRGPLRHRHARGPVRVPRPRRPHGGCGGARAGGGLLASQRLVSTLLATPALQIIAADLLAQAEHDTDALPVLVTTHEPLVAAVEAELARQLAILPTRAVAAVSVAKVREPGRGLGTSTFSPCWRPPDAPSSSRRALRSSAPTWTPPLP